MLAAVERSGRAPRINPARFRTARARTALVRAGLIGCSGLVGALGLAAALVSPPAEPVRAPMAVADASVAPAWIGIDHPLQFFTLAGSPYARLPLDYQARRRPDGSARQDTLTFGSFAGPAPFLILSLERSRTAPDGTSDLVVTTARIAGAAGIALLHAGQADALASRLGLFATVAVTLRSATGQRPCLGFKLEGRPPLAVAGLACGTLGHAPDPADMACTLDRLDLAVGGSEDVALRAFLGDPAPHRGQSCASVAAARS